LYQTDYVRGGGGRHIVVFLSLSLSQKFICPTPTI